MNRRTFLSAVTGGLLTAPLASAVEAGRMGVLSALAAPISSDVLTPFRERLAELSYVAGHNLAIEYRSAEERLTRVPALATELISLGVNVIIAIGPAVPRAVKSATATVPYRRNPLRERSRRSRLHGEHREAGGNITGAPSRPCVGHPYQRVVGVSPERSNW